MDRAAIQNPKSRIQNSKRSALLALGLCLSVPVQAAPPVPYATVFAPGTPDEIAYLAKVVGATAARGERHAETGQYWYYAFPVAPGASCRLLLTIDGDALTPLPGFMVAGQDGKPLPIHVQRETEKTIAVDWSLPANWPLGQRVSVGLSAPTAPFTLHYVQFAQSAPDRNGDGLPDVVAAQMRQGIASNYPFSLPRRDAFPSTITQTSSLPNLANDIQTDAVFVYNGLADRMTNWKIRGYTVWTMAGARAEKEYADAHPDAVQTDRNGNALTVEGSAYLTPTPERIALESDFFGKALAGGSEGICPEEPEYFANAGYENAFKTEWLREYKTAWQPPDRDINTRWRASRLMAKLETAHIGGILADAARRKPAARRLVALHSPINYAQWGIIAPQYQITSLPDAQEVIGQVWTGTARTPARYAGVAQDRTFSTAYLEYSSLYQLLRGTKKRLWFLTDPVEDAADRTPEDYKAHYEATVVAALLFPEVNAYEVMPWPDRVFGKVPNAYATEINSVIAAMQEMKNQPNYGGSANNPTIGVFVSDAMQYQRAEPNVSDFDGVFGLTLPLLQRGIPVQAVSLDRAADAGYLSGFKTLLLSYDFQKPPDARTQTALLDWTRRGGSLIFVGGSDAYNALSDSWWRKLGIAAPQNALFTAAGAVIGGGAITQTAPPEDLSRYATLLTGDIAEHNLKNRRAYTFDLTKFAQGSGSVAVRFADAAPGDGWGAWVASAELRLGGQIAASFRAGSDLENRFLRYDNGSRFDGAARFADGPASWTYQFDNLPRGQSVTLTVDMGNGFQVSAAAAQPNASRTLIAAPEAGPLANLFPRLQIGVNYPLTLYPSLTGKIKTPAPAAVVKTAAKSDDGKTDGGKMEAGKTDAGKIEPDAWNPLYQLRSGGVPVWSQTVDRGTIINVGVAPGYFSGSERSAAMLRALTQYATQRAGGIYREPGSLRLKRGRYTIIRTFNAGVTVEGKTINLFSPTLAVAEDREIPPRSLALLADLPDSDSPRIGFVSGRVIARLETPRATRFFVRGPGGTTGAARLAAQGRKLGGVRATDWLGRPIAIQEYVEDGSVLLRYPNHPDGVIVYAGWR